MGREKQLEISIGLKLRNEADLQKKVETNQLLSTQDMTSKYLPDEESQNKISDYLKSNGLNITYTYSNHMVIEASGTAQEIENAFKVKLSYYSHNDTEFFANDTEPQLPTDIAGLVETINGLNNVKLDLSSSSKKSQYTSPTIEPIDCSPKDIQKAYNLTTAYANNINGDGTKIAIASYYSFDQSDIDGYLNTWKITGTKPISVIPVDGTPQSDSDGSLETTVQIETAQANAPGAQILLYDGVTANAKTELDMFTKIVDDGQANIVSYTWGNCESMYTPAEINEMHNVFTVGTAEGMTFCVASGNHGSDKIYYPATDPYVTSVGGTSLQIDGVTGALTHEYGWDYTSSDDGEEYTTGSGGGKSTVFQTPSWQKNITSEDDGHRMIPDVALDANPDTGYDVYYMGQRIYQWGGTSMSTPVWASIFALVYENRKKNALAPMGLANPALYSLANTTVFHDITSGCNKNYFCSQGYDMVTGLGSVDAWKLITELSHQSQQVHSVTYNGNGNDAGSAPIDTNGYIQGSQATVLANTGNLSKAGYTFACWNTAADGSGKNYSPNDSLNVGASDITLYAKWNKVLRAIGRIDELPDNITISDTKLIYGWVLDSSGVKKIEVLIDGVVVGTAVYGDPRTDVAKVYPEYNTINCGYHYNLDTTKLSNGTHILTVRETGNNSVQTDLRTLTVTVSNPIKGAIDNPANGATLTGITTINGWVLDTCVVNKIEILIDGKVLGTAVYGDPRTDVAKAYPSYNTINCGYHYNLDTTGLSNSIHTLSVMEIVNGTGQKEFGQRTIHVLNNVDGRIDGPSDQSTLSGTVNVWGWALDGTGVSKVEVLLGTNVVGTAEYGSPRSDVAKAYPSYNTVNCGYNCSLDTTKIANGNYVLTVLETSNNNVKNYIQGAVRVTISNPDIGDLDNPKDGSTLTGINTINGWTLDNCGVNKVEVLVDDKIVGTAVYGTPRTDIAKAHPEYNNTNSGFSYDLDTTKLSAGNHKLAIKETASNTNVTVFGERTITVLNAANGRIDSPLNGTTISDTAHVSGWALDGAGVSKIEILVDGNVVGTAAYGAPRTDVASAYPSYNLVNCGYDYYLDTTKLTNGIHSITLREIGFNAVQTDLRTATVTVSNQIMGALDNPTKEATITGITTVNGWVLDKGGVNRIEILIDGKPTGTALYGDPRTDVANAHPEYNIVNCGYHYSLDTTKLSDGKHILSIKETANNTNITIFGERSINVVNAFIGRMDTPSDKSTINGTVHVWGWALDGAGVSKIEILVDGNVVGTAVYGSSRTDVAKAYPSYNLVNCGYDYYLDTTKLSNGSHTLSVRETSNNTNQPIFGQRTITVKN